MLKIKLLPLLAIPFLFVSIAATNAANPDPDGLNSTNAPMTAEQREMYRLDACSEWYGNTVGRMATLETRLNLTEQQRPLWNNWASVQGKNAMAQKERCIAGMPRSAKGDMTPLNAVEMEKRMEMALSDRLKSMQAGLPALETLYASLNAEQKDTFDRFYSDRMSGGTNFGNNKGFGRMLFGGHGFEARRHDGPIER